MSVLLAIFFIAGACSLAYQIIWIRLFGLVFGGTVVSMAVVVGVFMGGLALGSHVFGKFAMKVGNRVRLFGYLEIALGITAALVYFGIPYFSRLIYSLPFNADIHSFTGIIVRIVLSSALLVVPTMIMGGTLPVLVRAVTTQKNSIISNTSLLYAVNTLGAMTGAFLVGFVLIRYLGILRSNLLAAGTEVCVGIIALLISGSFESTPDILPEPDKTTRSAFSEKGLRFLVALGITGFAGLTLEMVWMRMILLIFNNTIYLYTIIITSFLLILGLGGFMLRFLIPDKMRTEKTLGIILAIMSLAICAGFILFPVGRNIISTSNVFYSTFTRLSILTTGFFFLLGFIPVFLMGLSFPIGLGLYAHEVRGLSGRVGIIYAVNTIGSLLGSLAAVFVLIPFIGMRGTLILCSILVMIPALYFIARERAGYGKLPILAGTCVMLLIFFIIAFKIDFPNAILRYKLKPNEYIEYIKEGPSSTIWITNDERGLFRKIWIDNLWVSSTSAEGTHALCAHYPILFHKNPKKVGGIAFGTGQTFGTCLLYPIESIISVEIDAEIIKACKGRFTRENYGILEDPRNTVIIDDGRFFLRGTQEKFDIITSEPLQPYTRGTVNLYSYEFYEACKHALLPGGIAAQWIPTYTSGVAETWSMIRTFAVSFDYVHLFQNGNDAFILGSDTEMYIDPSKPIPERALKDLKRIDNGDIYALTGNYICSREKLLEASKNYPIITDDRPSLEFEAPISHWAEELTAPVKIRSQFIELMEPVENLFTDNADLERARKFREGRKLQSQGYIMERTGNYAAAQNFYEQAYRQNPEDIKSIKSLILYLAKQKRLNELPDELKSLLKTPPGKK